jgi:hypothetical protein
MNLAETIVARLLNEEHFDVHQRTDLFRDTGKVTGDGRKVVEVCGNCESEFGSDRKYPPDVSMSHGLCARHVVQMYSAVMPLEQARTKVRPDNKTPDWHAVLGDSKQPPKAAPPKGSGSVVWNPYKEEQATPAPKATFWATSGGLA